jgi:hypothetical protein
MEITTDSELGQLDFVRPKYLTRSADGVIFRMVEIDNVVHIGLYFRRKEFCIERRFLHTTVTVEPGPVGERKRLCLSRFRGRSRLGQRGLGFGRIRTRNCGARRNTHGCTRFRRDRLLCRLMLLQRNFKLFDAFLHGSKLLHDLLLCLRSRCDGLLVRRHCGNARCIIGRMLAIHRKGQQRCGDYGEGRPLGHLYSKLVHFVSESHDSDLSL